MRHAILAMGLAGCVDVELPIHLDLFHDRPEDVARVEVWVDAGHVDVEGGDEPAVERRLRWEGDVEPESRVTQTGGTLVIDGRCPARSVGCAIDVSVVVARETIVEVFTGAGDVSVRGTSKAVFVDTAAGVVDLELLTGDVVAYTADGDVRGRDLASAEVQVDARGPVDLAFIAAPSSVDVLATDDVTLDVPTGAYRLELTAGTGEVVVQDVVDEPTSPYVLAARAAGDIEVDGH